MKNQWIRTRFNILEKRLRRFEGLVGPVDISDVGHIINSGDWLNLESICIGDIVGGVKIENQRQVEILNRAGQEIKKDYDRL
jgi:hypothetical protein